MLKNIILSIFSRTEVTKTLKLTKLPTAGLQLIKDPKD